MRLGDRAGRIVLGFLSIRCRKPLNAVRVKPMHKQKDTIAKRAVRLGGCVSLSAALVCTVTAPAAEAAGVLAQLQGRVLVNVGGGYETGYMSMPLKSGDGVLTMTGASAVVIQDDGCVTRLAENVVFMLQTPSVCDGGVDSARGVGPYLAQAIGAEEAPPAPATEVDAPEEQPEAVAEGEEVPEEEEESRKKGWLWVLAGLALIAGGSSSSSSSAVVH